MSCVVSCSFTLAFKLTQALMVSFILEAAVAWRLILEAPAVVEVSQVKLPP